MAKHSLKQTQTIPAVTQSGRWRTPLATALTMSAIATTTTASGVFPVHIGTPPPPRKVEQSQPLPLSGSDQRASSILHTTIVKQTANEAPAMAALDAQKATDEFISIAKQREERRQAKLKEQEERKKQLVEQQKQEKPKHELKPQPTPRPKPVPPPAPAPKPEPETVVKAIAKAEPVKPKPVPPPPPPAPAPRQKLSANTEGQSSSLKGTQPDVARVGNLIRQEFGIDLGAILGKGSRGGKSDHPTGHALDFMVDRQTGDRIASYALSRQGELGVKYVIWRQRYNDGSGWDHMEDRGSVTANHYDHVHISFH